MPKSASRKQFAILLLALAALPSAASAQAGDTPEAVVRRALEARERGDWGALAAVVHPATVEGWRDGEIRLADTRREQAQALAAATASRPGDPPLPECVRTYQSLWANEPEAVYGTADTAALRAIPARELLVRSLAWRAALRGAEPGDPAPRVVGWSLLDDSTALVFVRRDLREPVPWMQMGVVLTKPGPDGWMVAGEEGLVSATLGWSFSSSLFFLAGHGPSSPAPGSPEAVLLEAKGAAARRDWAGVAARIHPEAREEARRHVLRPLELTLDEARADAEAGTGAHLATLPACVQEHYRREWESGLPRELEQMRERVAAIHGTRDPAVLGAVPAEELLAREIAASLQAYHAPPPQPGVVVWTEVLGRAAEGDSLVHLMVQRRTRGPEPGQRGWSNIELVSLRRTPEGWRLAQPAGYFP